MRRQVHRREAHPRFNKVLHYFEDPHHETVHHSHRLCCSTFVRVLFAVSRIAHEQDWKQLPGTGCFQLATERRRDGQRSGWRRSGRGKQTQRAEGHCRCQPQSAENITQWTLPEEIQRWIPGRSAKGYHPGPEHSDPEEGRNEMHGGTGVPAMLGGLSSLDPSELHHWDILTCLHWAVV